MDVAIGLLAPFAVHPNPDVVLDVTYRHALMRYRTGDIPGALLVIEQGLQVSGGDGLLCSRLCHLQGQLLERLGQPEQAIQAYRHAIEVR
jgi:predicted RNA polymerase sigma factor